MELQSRHNLSILFISHDMAVVERVSHRVAVMYLGEILESGSREAVFTDARHPYTRKLLAAVPVADPEVARRRPPIPLSELNNPVRDLGYVPPVRRYETVAADHIVRVD